MWHTLEYYLHRARELRRKHELGHAIRARLSRWRRSSEFNARQITAQRSFKEYSSALPEGYQARTITLHLSVPPLPVSPNFAFSEHVTDESGAMTRTVLAVMKGGFAVSRDLGDSWQTVRVDGLSQHRVINGQAIGRGEYLIQAIAPESLRSKIAPLDLIVADERGKMLAKFPSHSHRWHGCRAFASAAGTLMFAEYLSNNPVGGRRPVACRVWRSRDRGRSWQTVFRRSGDEIRHFHFLQPRPGHPREWWLASGDQPHECHVWVSRDDGESWNDVSDAERGEWKIGGARYKRNVFRFTDLAWIGDEIVWGADDFMGESNPPGARVFRSAADPQLEPQFAGYGRWHFRNIVDIGDHLLLISQRSNVADAPAEDRRPGVYLMGKQRSAGGLVHLFDLDSYPSRDRPGFTFSKASRAAVDGTFFTYRSSEDVFPAGHRILQWNVRLE